MLLTALPIVTLVRPEQYANALFPMPVPLPAIVTPGKLEQLLNAPFPMLVTLAGILTLVSQAQPPNAPLPMLPTLSGRMTLISELPLNKLFPITVTVRSSTVAGIVIALVGGPVYAVRVMVPSSLTV